MHSLINSARFILEGKGVPGVDIPKIYEVSYKTADHRRVIRYVETNHDSKDSVINYIAVKNMQELGIDLPKDPKARVAAIYQHRRTHGFVIQDVSQTISKEVLDSAREENLYDVKYRQ